MAVGKHVATAAGPDPEMDRRCCSRAFGPRNRIVSPPVSSSATPAQKQASKGRIACVLAICSSSVRGGASAVQGSPEQRARLADWDVITPSPYSAKPACASSDGGTMPPFPLPPFVQDCLRTLLELAASFTPVINTTIISI